MRVRTTPEKAASGLCDGLSDPSMEAEAVVREARPDAVCDSGCGIAPGAAVDEGAVPDRRVLRPGEPTTTTTTTTDRSGGLHAVRGVLGRR